MFHMQRQRRLPEEHARFYAAEISLALNFLHDKGWNFVPSNTIVCPFVKFVVFRDVILCVRSFRQNVFGDCAQRNRSSSNSSYGRRDGHPIDSVDKSCLTQGLWALFLMP